MVYQPHKTRMGRKPLIQARVEESRKQAIEDYADTQDISQSEAMRRLLDAGLAAEGYRADGSKTPLAHLASLKTVLLGVGIMLLATAALGGALVTSLTVPLAVAGTLLTALGVLTLWTALLAQITLARPLKGLLGLSPEVDNG